MKNHDLEVVAPLVVEYYEWMVGRGNVGPEELLSWPLTRPQRKMLLERMDDINVLWGLTAPLREVAEVIRANAG